MKECQIKLLQERTPTARVINRQCDGDGGDVHYQTNKAISKVENHATTAEEYFALCEFNMSLKFYRKSLRYVYRAQKQTCAKDETRNDDPTKDCTSHSNEKIQNYLPQLLNNIGRCQLARGECNDAIKSHKEALSIYRNAHLPDDHPDVSRTLRRLSDVGRAVTSLRDANASIKTGRTYENQGRYEKAMGVYTDALDAMRKAFGDVHPFVAAQLNKKGILHWKMGDYEMAMTSLMGALRVYEMALGKSHPDAGETLHNIALVHYSKGEHDEAMSFYQKSFSVRKAALGVNHPDTARTIIRIGMVHDDRGLYSKAMKLFNEGLRIQKAALGNVHVDVAATLNSIGIVHEKSGEFEEAMKAYTEAFGIYKAELGERHVDVAVTLNNIGEVHRHLGKYDMAMSTYEKALNIMTEALGENHRNVAVTLHNIALVHSLTGKHSEALDLYRRALGVQRSALGDQHPDVAVTLDNMGELYERRGDLVKPAEETDDKMGKYQKATKLYKKALRVRRAALGDHHFFVALTLSKIGKFHQDKENDYNEALRRFSEALTIYKVNEFGREHPYVKEVMSNMKRLRTVFSNVDTNVDNCVPN